MNRRIRRATAAGRVWRTEWLWAQWAERWGAWQARLNTPVVDDMSVEPKWFGSKKFMEEIPVP